MGTALSGAGLLVSVGGFTFTLVQLRRTRSAAEEARRAVGRTEQRMATNTLLTIIPQLLQLDADISTALAASSTSDTVRFLARWRHTAAEVSGLVRRVSPDEETLIEALAEAVSLAALAEQALADQGVPPQAIQRARIAIGAACSHAGSFIIRLQSYTGE